MWKRALPWCSRWSGGGAGAALGMALLILAAAPTALNAQAPVPSTTPGAVPETAPPSQPAAATPQPQGQQAATADPFAADYLRLCAGCHTIGGGALTGPDLLPSTKWPRGDLRVAVKRMEKNVGPMNDEQVDGLTDLLQRPDLQARLDASREQRMKEMVATLEPGNPRTGHLLFFGESRFANGGMGCFGCHAAAGRGGNMGKDLTMAHQRLGEQSLMSATEKPAFPLMVAAYGNKPVTTQEATHIAAFLKATAAATSPAQAAQPATEAMGLAHAGAGGIFLAVVAGVALLARRRKAGVRARMVRDSFRR